MHVVDEQIMGAMIEDIRSDKQEKTKAGRTERKMLLDLLVFL